MIVTYLGNTLVKLQVGDLVVAMNPFEASAGEKTPKFGADIALVSVRDEKYGATEALTYGAKTPLIIDTPGEYEVSGIYITGFHTDSIPVSKSKEFPYGKTDNVSYCMFIEGVTVCHLGAQKSADIPGEVLEKMGEVDILIVPVGADALSPADAYKLIKKIDPKVIIPVSLSPLDPKKGILAEFLKEVGAQDAKEEEKFVFKKKDLEGKEEEVVILRKN